MRPGRFVAVAIVMVLSAGSQATEPDAATRRWWSHIQALANDGMRGRDTGSPEHRRAQEYAVRHLERNGLRAAGEQGFFQSVPLRSYRLSIDRSLAGITRSGQVRPLRWLRDITVTPAMGLPGTLSGGLIFAGSDNAVGLEVAGAVVVRLNPVRLVAGPPVPPPPAGAAAVLGIDSTLGPEPARWPAQNAVAMSLADDAIPTAQGIPAFRFNPASADVLFEGSGHTYKELLGLASSGRPVPSFALRGTLALTLEFEGSELRSDNVIGVLPGSDPALASQYVVLTAHIDGYGLGEPWGKDRIYNGAFDDAAYVATLLEFAERLRESGIRLRRSLLFAVFTGEEKGLLGSRYYTRHLTVPRDRLVANINLDQLRPVFPLHTLTMHAVDESSLGDTARQVAAGMAIRIQSDPEPLRNLVRRSDNFPFMEIGVPATGFVFGYQPGSSDEVAYRRWYRDRYHTPLDDLSQPWVPEAAAEFNEFFARFVTALANADEAPKWKAGRPSATVGAQAVPADLSALAAKAKLDRPVAAWCRGEFRSGRPGAFAVAVTAPAGGGRYLVLETDGTVAELAAFTRRPDLSCYSRAEAERLNVSIARSATIQGEVSPRWNTAVVCAFVDETTAVCWQYSPVDRMFVKVGEWVT